MIDIEAAVFSRISKAYDEKYPNGSRYGEPTDTPANFPCLTLVEIDNYTYGQSLTAELKEHHAWVVYEVNVYSNSINGAKQECKEIIKLVDTEMQQLGFKRMFLNQTKNTDTRIYRITARYRGVVSENYRIYKK
ncbi:MAG: hypothetical protein KH354_03970 [Clostridiales bacterium]|nr:hypothetical protein [Clostridiales bacterium]